MKTARRRFLQTVAGTASLGLVDVSWLRGLASFGAEPPPDKVQFSPDLEPLVRLIEETPRERCVAVFIDQLRRGRDRHRRRQRQLVEPKHLEEQHRFPTGSLRSRAIRR